MICERRRSSVHISNLSHGPTPRSKSPSGGVANRDALSRGKTPKIYKTRRGNCVSEGTTDKCFMDRWQCEVLAVAAAHRLSVGQASQIPFVAPYESHAAHDAESHAGRLSYEIQSSWYGLVATVESDNVALRSTSVVAVLVNGFVLLILGFGASTEDSWNSAILGIYVAGIIIAIASRGRMSQWTMPEFQVVDLTTLTPRHPSCRPRRSSRWR